MIRDVELGDLLAWEPRLEPRGDLPDGWRERELSWAVIARAAAPMLPPLRGGEVVILPRGAFAWSGEPLAALLRDLAAHDPAAVVIDEAIDSGSDIAAAPVPLLVLPGDPLTPDLESALNRLLTERRGDLYRAGAELGRFLTALVGRGADAARIVEAAASAVAAPVALFDRTGRLLAGAHGGSEAAVIDEAARVVRPLIEQCRLVIGPTTAERRAMARLVADRAGDALNDVLARSADLRPRGAARAQAVAELLAMGEAADRRDLEAMAARIGLPLDARYRVVVAPADPLTGAQPDWLRAIGAIHDAGRLDGADAYLVECFDGDGHAPAAASATTAGPAAVSGLACGVDGLPEAVRQARYVSRLIASGALPGPVAWFDRLEDVQIFRLLYELVGSAAARQYAHAALGALPARDRRGELHKTLLAFLDAGGSHVDAARRLGVHRNTLSYRLQQIEQAVDRDLREPGVRLALHLALLVDALPADPDGQASRRIPDALAAERGGARVDGRR